MSVLDAFSAEDPLIEYLRQYLPAGEIVEEINPVAYSYRYIFTVRGKTVASCEVTDIERVRLSNVELAQKIRDRLLAQVGDEQVIMDILTAKL